VTQEQLMTLLNDGASARANGDKEVAPPDEDEVHEEHEVERRIRQRIALRLQKRHTEGQRL
jgi:hypothetical protein